MPKDYSSFKNRLLKLIEDYDSEEEDKDSVPKDGYPTEDLENGGSTLPTDLEPELESAHESPADSEKKKRKVKMMAGIISKRWANEKS
jgi:hypothetical protein